jgi:hypothetical protein
MAFVLKGILQYGITTKIQSAIILWLGCPSVKEIIIF